MSGGRAPGFRVQDFQDSVVAGAVMIAKEELRNVFCGTVNGSAIGAVGGHDFGVSISWCVRREVLEVCIPVSESLYGCALISEREFADRLARHLSKRVPEAIRGKMVEYLKPKVG